MIYKSIHDLSSGRILWFQGSNIFQGIYASQFSFFFSFWTSRNQSHGPADMRNVLCHWAKLPKLIFFILVVSICWLLWMMLKEIMKVCICLQHADFISFGYIPGNKIEILSSMVVIVMCIPPNHIKKTHILSCAQKLSEITWFCCFTDYWIMCWKNYFKKYTLVESLWKLLHWLLKNVSIVISLHVVWLQSGT